MYTATTSGAAGLSLSATGLGSAVGFGSGAFGTALPFTGINAFFLALTALTIILMGTALLRIARTVHAPRL